ncbi:hypothetical protein NX774_16195 [Massilia agilis]|uniref:Uncharacterized protein n=1 Tax=Massilia agilis TaxID=1811226 RepID=A0ABT2DDR4_9BURK|nr:hypothetical protein [Massilia agilis]MCS0809465.1 hypothetical protein [Massilia agilis]
MAEAAGKITWRRVFWWSVIAYFVGKLVARWLYPDALTMPQVWGVVILLPALRAAMELRYALARYLACRQRGRDVRSSLPALLPVGFAGFVRFNYIQLFGFLQRRAPCPNYDDEFEHYKKSQHSTVILIALIACAVELPISATVIGFVAHGSESGSPAHVILLSFSLFAVLWLVGDRYLVSRSRHGLAGDKLYLNVGARFEAEIALASVQDVRLLTQKEAQESRAAWIRRNGCNPSETIMATPFDQPNLAISLDVLSHPHIEAYGIPREQVRSLLVYVDDPQSFAKKVQERLS